MEYLQDIRQILLIYHAHIYIYIYYTVYLYTLIQGTRGVANLIIYIYIYKLFTKLHVKNEIIREIDTCPKFVMIFIFPAN